MILQIEIKKVVFLQEIKFQALEDNIPELKEYFEVVLVSADPSDGQGTTPTSGASIDQTGAKVNIELLANDLPNGLLQFSNGRVPDDQQIRVATEPPEVLGLD